MVEDVVPDGQILKALTSISFERCRNNAHPVDHLNLRNRQIKFMLIRK